MLVPPAVSWILTVTLAAAGGWFVCQCVRPLRVSPVLHATMCAAMVAMAWPWGARVPHRPQAVLFAAGALWFLASAVRARRLSRAMADAHHALTALVMVWMPVAPSAHDRGGHAGHAAMTGMTGPPPAAVLFAAYFGLAALVWLADAGTASGPERSVRRVVGAVGHAAMSAGAGVLTLAMS